MNISKYTRYTEDEGETFRTIRNLTKEEDLEVVTKFIIDNQFNLDLKLINNRIYLLKAFNASLNEYFNEDFLELPENMTVRLANFYCEFINLLDQFEGDVEPSEDEMNQVGKLIINYRMDESQEMFKKVTLKAIEYFKEKENNNFEVDQRWIAGIKTINCLISTFLLPKGELEIMDQQNIKIIDEIIKILNRSKDSIYLFLDKLSNAKITYTLINLCTKRNVSVRLIINKLNIESTEVLSSTESEKSNFKYIILDKEGSKIINNFLLVDNKAIIGSFIGEKEGGNHLNETAIVIKSIDFVNELKGDFEMIWMTNNQKQADG